MAGHQRLAGKLVCAVAQDDESEGEDECQVVKAEEVVEPASPQSPCPPQRQASQSSRGNARIPVIGIKRENMQLLSDGDWHRWRNPNAIIKSPFRIPARKASLQSTVLCDEDGNTIRKDDDGQDAGRSDDGRADSRGGLHSLPPYFTQPDAFDDILGSPVATLFSIRKEELPSIREYATSLDLHIATFPNPYLKRPPRTSSSSSSSSSKAEEKEKDLWMVIGHRKDHVQYLMDIQQRKMPGAMGTIADLAEWSEASKTAAVLPPFWRWLYSFVNMVTAATIGAVIASVMVVYILSEMGGSGQAGVIW
ncbi:hypothetical protein ONZ45_g6060 [Pleurotus djamor]|nr:hypothetical protein ONZ45_g6060 [Pleurotus djamor]